MGKKGLLTGIFLILVIVGIAFGIKKAKNTPQIVSPFPTTGIVEEIERNFNLTIPSDVEKADLNRVGDVEGMGLATRKFEEGRFEVTILADLPETESARPYHSWLENGAGEKVILGDLRFAKGGYLLDFESNLDLTDFKKVIIAQEANILEGSF